jgi:hypothetical protein
MEDSMSELTGPIRTSKSRNNNTIIFDVDAPPEGYKSKLKTIVRSAEFHDEVSFIDIDNIRADLELGTATYDTEDEEFVDLELKQHVIENESL